MQRRRLGGERVAQRRQLALVGKLRAGGPLHHVKRRRVRIGGEDMASKAEARRRQCEHAPQLAAADNAECFIDSTHGCHYTHALRLYVRSLLEILGRGKFRKRIMLQFLV